MGESENLIANNIKKIPGLKLKKIFIIGLSDTCFTIAKILKNLGCELYAYASDDIIAINRYNKDNTIFSEKYFCGDIDLVIKILEFDEAVLIPDSVYLIASDHYEKKLLALNFKKNINYCRVER